MKHPHILYIPEIEQEIVDNEVLAMTGIFEAVRNTLGHTLTMPEEGFFTAPFTAEVQ